MKKKYEFISQIRIRFDVDLDSQENKQRYYPFDESEVAAFIINNIVEGLRNKEFQIDTPIPAEITWAGHSGNTVVSEATPNRHHPNVMYAGVMMSVTRLLTRWNNDWRKVHKTFFEENKDYEPYRYLARNSTDTILGGNGWCVLPSFTDKETMRDIMRDAREQIENEIHEMFEKKIISLTLEKLDGLSEDGLVQYS